MKTETLYVLLDPLGKSWVVKDQAIEPHSLAALLAEGWRPIRETAFSGSASRVLILLERESDEKFGFGFPSG